QAAAHDLGMDQAAFRRINFVRDDQFPHRTPFGFLTDSGQYGKCLDVGLRAVGYEDFLRQKEVAKAKGRRRRIGISTRTEPPVAGAAGAMVARKIRAKARKLAAHLREVSEEDVEWELGRFYVRSAPGRGVTIQECAIAAYSNMPDGMEPGLENTAYYDPPNLT